MCYSNCKNENYHGECKKRPNRCDETLHCFEGFKCKHCEDIFTDTSEMSDIENVCLDCEEHYLFDK